MINFTGVIFEIGVEKSTNRCCLSTNVSGSRGLAGNYSEFDDFDFYDGRGRMIPEENMDEDYVATHRRFRERAAAAFEEDLAELRRKRRDMQVTFTFHQQNQI